mgnify:CR=1 FL=1
MKKKAETAARLTVENATWSEPRYKETILHPISFDLAPHKILGVVGPNGSGKSTLLRLLYRFNAPTTGTVEVDNTDIWSISAKEAARIDAAVLQEQPADFGLTVREIVALGRTPYRKLFGGLTSTRDEEVLQGVLDQLGLNDFSNRQLKTLSGGERQRVMLARALAQEPKLLILDEPTNHLDIPAKQMLEDALRDYEGAALLVSHDRYFISNFNLNIQFRNDKLGIIVNLIMLGRFVAFYFEFLIKNFCVTFCRTNANEKIL